VVLGREPASRPNPSGCGLTGAVGTRTEHLVLRGSRGWAIFSTTGPRGSVLPLSPSAGYCVETARTSWAVTRSNGSRLRRARHSTRHPSMDASSDTARSAARAVPTPV
jgi:hypothetical protein